MRYLYRESWNLQHIRTKACSDSPYQGGARNRTGPLPALRPHDVEGLGCSQTRSKQRMPGTPLKQVGHCNSYLYSIITQISFVYSTSIRTLTGHSCVFLHLNRLHIPYVPNRDSPVPDMYYLAADSMYLSR